MPCYRLITPPCFSTTTTFSRSKNRADIASFAKSYFKPLRKVADPEEARGLPIVFRARNNKIEVCYDTEEGPINLCGLDVCMNEVQLLGNCVAFVN